MRAIQKNNRYRRALAVLGLLSGLSGSLKAQDEELLLELFHSSDAKNWQMRSLVPADVADGGIVVRRSGERGFYRLEIGPRFEEWGEPGNPGEIPTAQLPEHATRLAEEVLSNMRVLSWVDPDPDDDGEVPDGADDGSIGDETVLAPFAYPIFDPAINGGVEPAYFEFPLVKGDPAPDEEEPNPLLPAGPNPSGDDCELGFIRVSNSRMIEPVVSFATSGKSPVVALRQSAGGLVVRPVLFNDGYLVGENPAGELVTAIGNHPFDVDIEPFLQLVESGGSYSGSNGDEEEPSEFPGYEGEPRRFASYQELKDHHLSSPVLQSGRDRRAALAQRKWEIQVDGIFPQAEAIDVGETRTFLDGQDVISVQIDNNHRVAVDVIAGGGGISVTGLEVGGVLIVAELSDGSMTELILDITEPGAPVVRSGNWVREPYRIVGNRDWYRPVRYYQYKNYPQMCRTGWSGCGPTAWAILYAHWDHHGVPQALGDPARADAPKSRTNGADLACTDYVFGRVNPWCDFFWSGQALTWPWDLNRGIYWASHRGFNGTSRYTWGALWGDAGARRIAVDAVKAGRVAVTGVDSYQHYNVAVAHTQTIYRCGNHRYVAADWLAFNNGHGDKHIVWKDSHIVWWAADTRLHPTN